LVSENLLEKKMSSVLNVGVMSTNPVGNQIRRLETALDAERKDKQMLLLALEIKAPEVFAEYTRLKDEAEERAIAAQKAAQAAQAATRYQPSIPVRNTPGGRF
jgi:hypothetical protein